MFRPTLLSRNWDMDGVWLNSRAARSVLVVSATYPSQDLCHILSAKSGRQGGGDGGMGLRSFFLFRRRTTCHSSSRVSRGRGGRLSADIISSRTGCQRGSAGLSRWGRSPRSCRPLASRVCSGTGGGSRRPRSRSRFFSAFRDCLVLGARSPSHSRTLMLAGTCGRERSISSLTSRSDGGIR